MKSINEFSILSPPDPTKANLGHGSYGVVKLAKNLKNNSIYALKIIDCKKLRGPNEIEIIQREIKIHSNLDHPNIIKFHGTFKEDNTITMVLDYAENGNLYSYLRKQRKLKESEAFVYFYQTMLAIEYLHKNDILHRDIKPENLLLDSNYCIKLCDFGWSTEDIKMKRTTFCGTYEYMSPEVVFKKPYNENIDVWSLGVLLFELLHGRSAFKAKNLNEISAKLSKPIELNFDINISEDVKSLIKGILRIDPNERMSLKEIFQHSWVKTMLNSKEYTNHQQNKQNSDFLKSIQRPPVIKANAFNRDYKKKTYNFKYGLESQEKPFQKMAHEENAKNYKKLYSFQALDEVSAKLKLKPAFSFEKENYNNDSNAQINSKNKIFEKNQRESSPEKILKSMENLIFDFERKLKNEDSNFVSAMFKKYEIK